MPGKDGRLPKDNRSLNSLVRFLHCTHHRLFDGLPRSDGFVLDVEVNSTLSNHHQTIVLPPLSGAVLTQSSGTRHLSSADVPPECR